jgi:spermidine export protein MdtJ
VAWVFLILAMLTEVVGTSAMNASADADNPAGIAITIGMICVSYILLSFAVRTIPIGVAFAVWEGLGLVLVTCVSVGYFQESLSAPAALGIIGVLVGIVLLHQGVSHQDDVVAAPPSGSGDLG